jgi:DUF4097 and DUF4098 domain-containing protein YvlB
MTTYLKRTTLLVLALTVTLCAFSTPVEAAEFSIERTLAITPGGVFDLESVSGRVEIRGTSRSDVLVVVRAKKEEISEHHDFSFEEQGDRVVVRVTKRRGHSRRWISGNEGLEFVVEVPTNTNLEIDTSGGSISVENIDGTAHLHTSGGSITATDLGATAKLSTSGGGITVEGVAGDLDADTSGGSIKIAGAKGSIDADTSGGSITASFTAGNTAGGTLSTSGGSITAYVDADAGFDLDASTSGGRVTVDIPVTVRGEISRRSVRGEINGGGAPLRLDTSGGNINVRPL